MSERRPIGLAPGAPAEAAGQDERKYTTGNPVVRWLLQRWMSRLIDVVGQPPHPGLPGKIDGRRRDDLAYESGKAVMNLIRSPNIGSGGYYNGTREARANAQAYDPAARTQLRELSERLTAER